uniref:Putative portal protein n=1 Tax=viral metagenome TaxID=1070528 RepID=A0A6H1ZUN6_9ZZZZ
MRIALPFTDKGIDINIKTLPSRITDSRYWPDSPSPVLWSQDSFKNSGEQLKAYTGWVSDCVSLIAERIASLPLRLYDSNNELIEEHPFYDLLKHFNPDTTQFSGKELLSIYLDLTGECYILMAKDGLGIPRELYFRQPDRMTPKIKNGIIDHYVYLENGREVNYPREDILFFRYPNPTDPFRGASPVQRKAYAYDTDKYNMIYQMNMFKNGVHLKQVLQADKMIPPDQVKKILELFNQTYGGVDKVGKTGALIGGMKLETVGVSNKDMEFMLLANWTMRQLASAYHTPPQKLSHPEQTNLANMQALDVSWNRECILPRLVRIAEIFNTFMMMLYKEKGLYCKFDNPVPADDEFLLKKRESNLKNFVININEARVEDGLDEVSWGKVPLAPMNIMPLGDSGGSLPPKEEPKKIIKAVKYTAEYKKRYWELFIKRITPLEADFKRGMVRLFQDQELRALRALRNGKSIVKKDIDDVLRITHDEREIMKFAEFVLPRITQMVKINGEAAAAELGITFDVTNPKVVKWIKERGGMLIKSISDTTLEKLKKTLAEGIANGESIPNLADRIGIVYDEAKGSRAVLIARTETITASNSGSYQAYKQSDVVEKKEWLATMDDRVRDEHAAMNGEVVDLDKPFSNGLMFPSEPNCRCTILPVIKD